MTAITGIGAYIPEKVLTNQDLEKMIDTSDEWITERTGIKERHIAKEDEFVSDMATKAALEAIEMAKLKPENIDLIIMATVTQEFSTPSSACIVQANIGAKNAAAFDISAACAGFLYALSLADAMIKTGQATHAIVIGAESLSKITDWEDRNTCVLFGDGAGAVVLSKSDEIGIEQTYLGADGTGYKHITRQNLAVFDWDTLQRDGQRGNSLYMNGSEVYKFAVKAMVSAVEKVLEKAGVSINDIDYLFPHQANIRIIEGATKRLKMPANKVFKNIDKYGNISAACIPVALYQAHMEKKIKKGDKLAAVGFGAGLTWASAIINWTI